ncbi:MAG TPA: DUF6398 domain-containing protein [Gemmataceae bacterium]|jgi:hypothetical protein
MLLTPQDVELFFKLHRALMFFVNQRLKVLADEVASPDEFSSLSPEIRLKVRDAFLKRTDLIEAFADENPAHLTDDELDTVRSWRHLVHGKFYVFRQLKKYMVFLSADEQPVAYGVLALSQPFEELVGPYLPVLTQTVLLPFKGMIVYDGLMSSYRISFGPGIRRSLNEGFKEAKARHGIVTSLPMSDEPLPVRAPKPRPVPKPPTKEQKDEAMQSIIGLIDQFCKEHLNEEYAVLCRNLAEKLGRKRPSPLLHGKPETWASGIVRTIGWINFLHDKSQTPYMRATDIDHYLGTSPSSGAAKLAAIRKMFRMHLFDHEWTLPSRMEDNPLVWMLNVNGLMLDVRQAPREVQEIAFRKGLIPYIPADRRQGE